MSSTTSRRFRPQFERLERRELHAVVTPIGGSELFIEGDSGGDLIFIHDNGDGDVKISSKGVTTTAMDITKITVQTKGHDGVVYEQFGDRTRDMEISIDLGWGDDQFGAFIHGDILAGKTLDLRARGSDGADFLGFVMDGDVHQGGELNVRYYGDDLFSPASRKPPGNGFADDDDTIMVMFNGGVMNGVFNLNVDGDYGNDRVFADLDFATSSQGRLAGGPAVGGGSDAAQVRGGYGDDTLYFSIHAGSGLNVSAEATGGDGEDTCQHTVNVGVAPDVEDTYLIF